MTPEQRAEHLENAMDMATANDAIAEEGESRVSWDELFAWVHWHKRIFRFQVIDRDEQVNLHFVCFVGIGNELYELDGRYPHPKKHSSANEKTNDFDLLRVSSRRPVACRQ